MRRDESRQMFSRSGVPSVPSLNWAMACLAKPNTAVLPAGERKEREEEERVQLSGTSRFLVGLFLLTIHI